MTPMTPTSTKLDFHALNAMLNLPDDKGQIQFDADRMAARQYFLLKKHVQNTSGRNGSCVLCTCFLLFDIHPHGQRLICCRICAISALE